ncbi:MAG: S24/S26 family peptidase [Lachnospiraceae bacterium]|nr:S24/S26 family peptidase [Lachnospiraceae bacterium]
MEEKIDILELLKEGKTIQIKPEGYSMHPLLVPGRDEAILRPVKEEDIKRGQVLLFRGKGELLTLHRVWKVKKDGVYFVGDNQVEVEGPIPREKIYATMCGYIRKNKEYAVDGPIYLLIFRTWLFLRPIRFFISKPIAKLRGNI